MRLLNDFREDMRLARLNNPAYAFFFRALDVVQGLFKLLAVAVFCLGIWYIIDGVGSAENARRDLQYVKALQEAGDQSYAAATPGVPESNTVAITAQPTEVNELTPERIELLRKFASENRVGGSGTSESNAVTSVDPKLNATINKVPKAEAIADSNEVASTADKNDPLDLEASFVFDALEKRLQTPTEISASARATPARLDSVTQDENRAAVTKQPPQLAAANDKINNEAWLLAQKPELYTIQIGSTTNRPFLVSFSRLLPNELPKAIYQYTYRNEPEFGLSYGLFASAGEANTALETLSKKVRRYGAFSRKLSIIHEQVKKSPDAGLAQGSY